MNFFRRASAVFKRHSFIGSMSVYGCLYGSGDVTRQTIQGVPQVDYKNSARMATVGSMLLAPAYYSWYKILDRVLIGTSPFVIAQKVVLDQCIAGACGVVLFYTGMSVLERKANIFDELKLKGLNTFLVGCTYWPLIQAVNFRFAPPYLRTAFVAAAAFVWCIILSFIKSFQVSHETRDP